MVHAVLFLGFREDIPEFLKSLDVFVLSSSDEGFSLSTIQAMATARPVVATRCGGPDGVVEDGVTGSLVSPGDPTALALAIVLMLRWLRAAGFLPFVFYRLILGAALLIWIA